MGFSCLPLPWLLPAPSLRRAWRPLRPLPMSTTPLAMSLSTIPLQLFPTSMMPLVMLLTFLPLKLRLTSMTSPATLLSPTFTWGRLLPPLLPLLPSPTLPTPTMPDTPTPLLPTTQDVSTTLAALCPAHKRLAASKLRPKDRQRTAKDRGRLENKNWMDCGRSVGPT